MFPPTEAPSLRPASQGVFDEAGEILTLSVLADAPIQSNSANENFGNYKRLNVAKTRNREKQSLLLFDLSYVAKSFGQLISEATLSLYLVSTENSDVSGITLKKMSHTDWTEDEVSWKNVPGGIGSDEAIISFVDRLQEGTWYEIDVTAAVQDALENNEPLLGIRLVSDSDNMDVYFGSREREKEPPQLVIDGRTLEPTGQPTPRPTTMPTHEPMVPLDCMDKRGTFVTHTGAEEPCSWLSIGGSLTKAFNCQGGARNEVAMFCQAQCSAYNGCDDLHCEDKVGSYENHMGYKVQCSWLLTGPLKIERNCGAETFSVTELGMRCQKTCGDYNGCRTS